MSDEFKKVILLADYGSLSLAQKVYNELSKKDIYGGLEVFDPNGVYVNRFANREINVDIMHHVRGRDVFLFKSFCTCEQPWDKSQKYPPKDKMVFSPTEAYHELFLLNDALWRGEASTITNVLPFMPYQRQDRRPETNGRRTRSPISAKVFAAMFSIGDVERIITLDSHFKQIEGFHGNHYNELESFVLFAEYIEKTFSNDMDKIVFVAPDQGSRDRAKKYAAYFKRPYTVVDKERNIPGACTASGIVPDMSLTDAICIIPDDIVDGGGTLVASSGVLRTKGAKEIIACCTHPVLSGTAKDKLVGNNIKLITTESIPVMDIDSYPNITVLDTSYPIARAIWCICNGKSISQHLFDYDRYKATRAANP
ncbi:MAG: ribose-phosphate diphosphokinase [Candidatus Nanoarchaeia archaeon]|nr:ribose-phosphate diphosphokinase [Candidatus Nanoarchaeia archaeon]